MKSKFSILLVVLFTLTSIKVSLAQDLTIEYKTEVVKTLSQLMNDYYVFPEVAKTTQAHLESQLARGHFDEFIDNESFAKALTESVQSINKDKHMKIWQNPPFEAPKMTADRMVEEKLHQLKRYRAYNGGFHAVKILEGNVGYIDLRGFAGVGQGKLFADAYMKLIAQTDAVIIDLSNNGGGDPAMVQYLCSYFFDEVVHLNSLYFRNSDKTIDFFSLEKVDGEKMPDIPLFVITGKNTFSGAEEFSYNMQTQKRATLIGQTTGGGANPGGTRGINEHLSVFIPTGRAINPITKTNWEGTGVVPELLTTEDETLTKAQTLAAAAAEEYRNKSDKEYKAGFLELANVLDSYDEKDADTVIEEAIKKGYSTNIFNEEDINTLGYTYLMEYEKPVVARAIFRSNTILFPKSPNAYDSYAECYMMMGDLANSALNYEKAVTIAKELKDPGLEFYEENLAKVKQMIADKE